MSLASADMVQIVPGRPEMGPVACELIYMTMGKMADYLLGEGDEKRACGLLMRLFRRGSNRFSYRFTQAATISGGVVGIIVTYSEAEMRKLEVPMALHLIREIGLRGFVRFTRRALPLVRVKEAEEDEYFIGNVAVLPEQQGKGIGSRLLAKAEEMARTRGYRKLSLTVDVENERARALYLRSGFELAGTVEVPELRSHFGYRGFYRMVRRLP